MYLEHYHLHRHPFQLNTDPSFLWLGEKHREALSTLRYGLNENRGFLLLTGDVGVGKTTVVNALLEEIPPGDPVVVVHDPVMESLDFFNYVARSFGLPGGYRSKGEFLIAFSSFLLQCYYKNRRPLLIIDECQLLKPSFLTEIRLFSNFEKKGVKLVNVFFVGQLQFHDILLHPEQKATRQRINVNYTIEPLDLHETAAYISHRLALAGCRKNVFRKGAIREIYRFSRGSPRLINTIADRALLTGYVESRKRINKRVIHACVKEMDLSGYPRTAPAGA
jgi:general secretion pathway protein A